MWYRFLVAALLLLESSAVAAQQDAKRLQLEQYLDIESVSNPQLSPDGLHILYSRRWVDRMNDRRTSALWIMNVDGSRNRFLVSAGSARWSPDGTRIAYTKSSDSGASQIFIRWMDGEEAESQITRLTESPSDLQWSPDGQWIAFTMFVPATEKIADRWRIRLPGRPPGATWTPDPRIEERVIWRADRIGFLDEGFRHVFVVPATGGTPRQITTGDWDHTDPVWTPDGRTILVTANRVDDAKHIWRESEIYAVDVATGAIRQLTQRKGPDSNPVVSPDGRWIAYTGYDVTEGDHTRVQTEMYVMNANGGEPRHLTAGLDRAPENLIWANDNSGIYFLVPSEGTRNLWFAPLNGELRQTTEGMHMLSVSDIGADGTVVGTRESFHEPGDIITFDLSDPARIQQLTRVNEDVLAGVELGEVEEIWYRSVDDFRVQGWIIKPPDFDPSSKYPLILAIHGGPHAMYDVGFNFAWQEHAANGYVVLYTNPRGSTGYGETFAAAIRHAFPDKDYVDLMTGVDSVVAHGYIDDRNMFVYGCSGGGALTAWVVGHTDRFAAAVVQCPVINWLSFIGNVDDTRRSSVRGNFDKWPWEDATRYLERSPLMYVGNVTTPTMLMTGVRDLRTPISQSVEFYQALKLRKVPAALVRMNDEWHGVSSRPSNFMRAQLYLRKWFERWSTGLAATSTEGGEG